MKCEILKTFRGSPDGGNVFEYIAGTTEELTARLAEVAIGEGWARPARETAAFDRAPEIKPDEPKARKGAKK